MRFTTAQPEVSCHPEELLASARSVVSAALCYYAPGPEPGRGEGRLPRYTWWDAYESLREKLDELGRRLGGSYRVLVDANQHGDREAAEPVVSLVEWLEAEPDALRHRYERLYVARNDGRYLQRNALVALGNAGGAAHRDLLERYAAGDDELLREHAEWSLARLDGRLG